MRVFTKCDIILAISGVACRAQSRGDGGPVFSLLGQRFKTFFLKSRHPFNSKKVVCYPQLWYKVHFDIKWN